MPHHQGSVKRANQIIKKMIEAMRSDEIKRQEGRPERQRHPVRWPLLLGRVMAACNGIRRRQGRGGVPTIHQPYRAVFGDDYTRVMRQEQSNLGDLRTARDPVDRLRLTRDLDLGV